MKKIVLFVGNHIRTLHFMNTICAQFDVAGVVLEERENIIPEPDPSWTEHDKRNFIHHFKNRYEAEQKYFGSSLDKLPDVPIHRVESKMLNSQGTIDFVKNINPDIVLIYGTAMIKNELFSLMPELTINLHSGLLPKYKGKASSFWPFYMLEPNWVGASFHIITPKTDAGDLVHQVVPTLEYGDNLQEVASKTIFKASDEALKVLDRCLKNNITTVPQKNSGRLFLESDFNPNHLRLIYDIYDDKIVDLYLDGKITPNPVNLVTL